MEFAAIMVPMLVVLVLIVYHQQDKLDKRLRAIERRLERTMDHLGVEEAPTPVIPEVMRHLDAGRKIQAIKAYRQATGAGLREAKDAVDELARRRRGSAGGAVGESP